MHIQVVVEIVVGFKRRDQLSYCLNFLARVKTSASQGELRAYNLKSSSLI